MATEHNNKWQINKMLEERIIREMQLLKDFDPDEELKGEFEMASLSDLQNELDPQDAS